MVIKLLPVRAAGATLQVLFPPSSCRLCAGRTFEQCWNKQILFEYLCASVQVFFGVTHCKRICLLFHRNFSIVSNNQRQFWVGFFQEGHGALVECQEIGRVLEQKLRPFLKQKKQNLSHLFVSNSHGYFSWLIFLLEFRLTHSCLKLLELTIVGEDCFFHQNADNRTQNHFSSTRGSTNYLSGPCLDRTLVSETHPPPRTARLESEQIWRFYRLIVQKMCPLEEIDLVILIPNNWKPTQQTGTFFFAVRTFVLVEVDENKHIPPQHFSNSSVAFSSIYSSQHWRCFFIKKVLSFSYSEIYRQTCQYPHVELRKPESWRETEPAIPTRSVIRLFKYLPREGRFDQRTATGGLLGIQVRIFAMCLKSAARHSRKRQFFFKRSIFWKAVSWHWAWKRRRWSFTCELLPFLTKGKSEEGPSFCAGGSFEGSLSASICVGSLNTCAPLQLGSSRRAQYPQQSLSMGHRSCIGQNQMPLPLWLTW